MVERPKLKTDETQCPACALSLVHFHVSSPLSSPSVSSAHAVGNCVSFLRFSKLSYLASTEVHLSSFFQCGVTWGDQVLLGH